MSISNNVAHGRVDLCSGSLDPFPGNRTWRHDTACHAPERSGLEGAPWGHVGTSQTEDVSGNLWRGKSNSENLPQLPYSGIHEKVSAFAGRIPPIISMWASNSASCSAEGLFQEEIQVSGEFSAPSKLAHIHEAPGRSHTTSRVSILKAYNQGLNNSAIFCIFPVEKLHKTRLPSLFWNMLGMSSTEVRDYDAPTADVKFLSGRKIKRQTFVRWDERSFAFHTYFGRRHDRRVFSERSTTHSTVGVYELAEINSMLKDGIADLQLTELVDRQCPVRRVELRLWVRLRWPRNPP